MIESVDLRVSVTCVLPLGDDNVLFGCGDQIKLYHAKEKTTTPGFPVFQNSTRYVLAFNQHFVDFCQLQFSFEFQLCSQPDPSHPEDES